MSSRWWFCRHVCRYLRGNTYVCVCVCVAAGENLVILELDHKGFQTNAIQSEVTGARKEASWDLHKH